MKKHEELDQSVIEQQLPTYIGPLEPFEFTISNQAQGQYLEALEDYHLRYVLGRQGAPPVIHPGILLNHSNATKSPSFNGPNRHWIHLREQTHFAGSAHLNDGLIVRWRIEEHEPWFGRVLTRVSCVVTRCDGLLILERTMCGIRTSARRPIPAEGGRAVPDPANPAPMSRGHSRTSLDPTDWEIPGKQKRPTAERIGLFSGRASQNLHTNDQIAKDAGLPAPVASATQGMGYLCEFMIDNLGEEWLASGSWVLTFRKPIFPGDEVRAFGRLRHVEPTDCGAQCTVDIKLVNQRGVTVTHGTATGHRKLG